MPWHSANEPDERARSIARLRAEFEALPPELQRETLERVRQTLAAEARRKQVQPSYLARIAREVYGIGR